MKKFISLLIITTLFTSCMNDIYTITAESNDPSLGTVTGGGSYVEGSTAVLSAIPNPGCKFDHWTYDSQSTDNPLKFIVWENESITAVFKRNASVVVSDGSGWNNKPEYYRCDLDVASKKMIYESKPTATSSDGLIHLEFNWAGTIRTGIFSGHTDVDFATTQVSHGWWGGYYEEIDLAASHISFGNPLLWDASKPYGYESYGSSISVGSVSVGNFLAKDVTLKITSIDLNNMLVSFVAEATKVNIAKCVETNTNWDEAATSKLKVEATDIPLVVY